MSRNLSALVDILDAIDLVERYMKGVSKDAFEDNLEKQYAVLRRITIIGEATKRLTKEFRAEHPSIPWKQIAGIRDVLSHDYDEVDIDDVWVVICEDILQLSAYIRPLVTDR